MITDKSSVASFTVDEPAVERTIALAIEQGIKIVDLKFIDLPGLWQHFSIPVADLKPDLFKDGIGFDGSSIRGFQKIHESDMLLIADPTTAFVDPTLSIPTLVLTCDVIDPITRQLFREAGIVHGMRVRDVGTGAGDVAFLVAELVGDTGEVVGVDRAPNALAVARARADAQSRRNVLFREGDPAEMTFERTFDAVVWPIRPAVSTRSWGDATKACRSRAAWRRCRLPRDRLGRRSVISAVADL